MLFSTAMEALRVPFVPKLLTPARFATGGYFLSSTQLALTPGPSMAQGAIAVAKQTA